MFFIPGSQVSKFKTSYYCCTVKIEHVVIVGLPKKKIVRAYITLSTEPLVVYFRFT